MPTPTPTASDKPCRSVFPHPWLIVALAAATVATFLVITPGGFLDKMDMCGYAVCHRIRARSFIIAGRQLPLCARCSGTFIGALVGFLGQAVVLRRRRAAEFPSPLVLAFLIGFSLLWAVDGLNSYMTLINGPHLYEPQNWLRLATGSLHGLTMSAFVYPVLNFTLWQDPPPDRTIRNLRELGVLLLLEAGLVGSVLTQRDFLLYPLALLGAAGVLTLLTCINSMLLLMITRRENMVDTWRASIIPLLAGLTLSLIQVGVIDIIRYAFTGTLMGIPPLE
jgi:uncharacterized membrane protein